MNFYYYFHVPCISFVCSGVFSLCLRRVSGTQREIPAAIPVAVKRCQCLCFRSASPNLDEKQRIRVGKTSFIFIVSAMAYLLYQGARCGRQSAHWKTAPRFLSLSLFLYLPPILFALIDKPFHVITSSLSPLWTYYLHNSRILHIFRLYVLLYPAPVRVAKAVVPSGEKPGGWLADAIQTFETWNALSCLSINDKDKQKQL